MIEKFKKARRRLANASADVATNHKLYKSGKHLVTASMLMLSLSGMAATAVVSVTPLITGNVASVSAAETVANTAGDADKLDAAMKSGNASIASANSTQDSSVDTAKSKDLPKIDVTDGGTKDLTPKYGNNNAENLAAYNAAVKDAVSKTNASTDGVKAAITEQAKKNAEYKAALEEAKKSAGVQASSTTSTSGPNPTSAETGYYFGWNQGDNTDMQGHVYGTYFVDEGDTITVNNVNLGGGDKLGTLKLKFTGFSAAVNPVGGRPVVTIFGKPGSGIGIAYSIRGTEQMATGTGSAGEGGGGAVAGGTDFAHGYVKSFSFTPSVSDGYDGIMQVSDIDDSQVVTFSGDAVEKGSAISISGNKASSSSNLDSDSLSTQVGATTVVFEQCRSIIHYDKG
jgi:biotin carboxyl carrier protein